MLFPSFVQKWKTFTGWDRPVKKEEEDAPGHKAGSWLLLKTCLPHDRENKIILPYVYFPIKRGFSIWQAVLQLTKRKKKPSMKLQKSLHCYSIYSTDEKAWLVFNCHWSPINRRCSLALLPRKLGPCIALRSPCKVVKWVSNSPQVFASTADMEGLNHKRLSLLKSKRKDTSNKECLCVYLCVGG